MTTEVHSGRHLVAQENKANLTVGRVASVLSDTHTEQRALCSQWPATTI